MQYLGDYEQNLNKLGQLLVLVKFANSKAVDDATRLRHILSQVFPSECLGVCYFLENSSSLVQQFGDLQLHRAISGLFVYSKCFSVDDLKLALGDFRRTKSQTDILTLSRHLINLSEANCDFESLLELKISEDTILITKDFDKTVNFAIKTFIAEIFSYAKKLLTERKNIPMDSFAIIEKTLRNFQPEEKVDQRKRKYLVGRWAKHLGDLSFCCGMLPDAEQYFSKATELLKGASDPWLAASKESLVVVSMLNATKLKTLPDCGPLGVSLPVKQWSQWLASFEEAANIYLNFRQCHHIYLESLLRLVHLQLLANLKCSSAKTLALFASFNVLSNSTPRNQLDSDQAYRYMKSAKVFESVSWHRKAAFYYRNAAMRCVLDSSQPSEWITCHRLLMKAVKGYGLASFSHGTSLQGQHSSGFIQLQSRLLMDLYTSSQAFNNYPLALRHACQALDIGGQTLFSYQLSQIFTDMRRLSPFASTLDSPLVLEPELVLSPLNSSPYPRLLAVSFHPETVARSSSVIRPSTSLGNLPQSPYKSSFIYSPFSRVEKPPAEQQICVCLGEDIKLVLDLENPFVNLIKIERLVLLTSQQKTEHVECFILREETLYPGAPKSVVLSCRCSNPGNLLLTGCLVTICGVTRKILFSDVLVSSNRLSKLKSCFEVEILPTQLPFLYIKQAVDSDIEIDAFLGEVAETRLLMENSNPDVRPNVVDLTLKGVPAAVEKSLSVTFLDDYVVNIRIDGNFPSRFSAAFEVSAKFVYQSLNDSLVTDDGSNGNAMKPQYFRSLTFTFRACVSAVVHGTVVGIERKNRRKLVLDVKLENVLTPLYSNHSVDLSLINDDDDDPSQSNLTTTLVPGEKRHIHCQIDNEKLVSLLPVLGDVTVLPVVDCVDLSPILKFQWEITDFHEAVGSDVRSGHCSAIVCGADLIDELRLPPFDVDISWTKTGAGALEKYDYGEAVPVSLARPVTFCLTLSAVVELPDVCFRLNVDALPVGRDAVHHVPAEDNMTTSQSQPAYIISGVCSTVSKQLAKRETLGHTFCLIPIATGRHRVFCDVVTANGHWPLCPTIYLNCVD